MMDYIEMQMLHILEHQEPSAAIDSLPLEGVNPSFVALYVLARRLVPPPLQPQFSQWILLVHVIMWPHRAGSQRREPKNK